MAPKAFNRSELRIARALDVGPVQQSDLVDRPTYTTWQFFQPGNWQVEQEEYNALLPSMRLASWLLEVGMPYWINFLPSKSLHARFGSILQRGNELTEDDYTIPLLEKFAMDEMDAARTELGEIAKVVKWQVNGEMWTDNKWLGITRTAVNMDRPWSDVQKEDIENDDNELKLQGKTRREMIIGIAGEYVQALNEYPHDSEIYLRAVFYAAITMAHEVAHGVWHQDFRSIDYDEMGYEPWVSDGIRAELGFSFIAWIFYGFTPELCDMGDGNHKFNLQDPLSWKPQHVTSSRQLYQTWTSIPVSYMQTVLQRAFWEGLGDCLKPDFSTKARDKLDPELPRSGPKDATASLPLWTVIASGHVVWKSGPNLKAAHDPIRPDEVTQEEIEWFKFRERQNTESTLDPQSRAILERFRKLHATFDSATGNFLPQEDDEEEFGGGSEPVVLGGGPVVAELYDGYLREDLGNDLNDTTACSTIHVGYRAPKSLTGRRSGTSSKRARDEEDEDNLGVKRARKGKAIETIIIEDIDKLLGKLTTTAIAKLTRIEAYNFCNANGISTGGPLLPSEGWQMSPLQTSLESDAEIIQSIRNHELNKAEIDFANDCSALIKITEARLTNLHHWSPQDLRDCAVLNSLSLASRNSAEEDGTKHHSLVKAFFESRLQDLRASCPDEQDHNGQNNAAQADDKLRTYLEDWGDEELEAYTRSNNLSDWGERDAHLLRVYRHHKEKAEREPKSDYERYVLRSEAINQNALGQPTQREDQNGVERYRFLAKTARCSVVSLKTKLLEAGYFPLNAVLQLHIGDNRRTSLEDFRPLDSWSESDLANLWLVVQTPESETAPRNEAISGRTSDGKVIYMPSSISLSRSRRPDGPSGSTSGGSGGGGSSSARATLSSSVANISAGPTVAEMLQQITNSGTALTRAAELGNGDPLRPNLRGHASTSAAQMLDNLRDLEETRLVPGVVVTLTQSPPVTVTNTRGGMRRRVSGIDLTVDEEEDELDGLPRVPRAASNMKDIYRKL